MATCLWCDEVCAPDEPITTYLGGEVAHLPCTLRQVLGSVAHLVQRCSCYVPGSTASDPPGLTRRQAAQAGRGALALD